MNWAQVFALIVGNMGLILPLWLWNRAESRNDNRHMDAKIEAHQKQIIELISAIKDEMKDFHGRLCAIEEKNRK